MMQEYTHRLTEKQLTRTPYWADSIAEYLITTYPDREEHVCAAGISPSGPIHFGNFREVLTAYAVAHAIKRRGKHASCVLSWDNFDRFRKVPRGLDASYEEHIGKPLADIPSPTGSDASYALAYQEEFQRALEAFNIRISYREQNQLYAEGAYTKEVIHAMQQRKQIAKILLAHMTDKGKETKGISDKEYTQNYYPISIYSEFTGKDATEILSYDGDAAVRYRCKITKKESTVDLRKNHIVKLAWKVDWAMRWAHEKVCFEPGGSDHAAMNSSYDVSSAIAKEIFEYDAPVFTEYGFVGLEGVGSKMSGSSGAAITPNQLLTIYEPTLLLWMYLRRLPNQTFSLSFDTEVFRQYDELDVALNAHTKYPAFLQPLVRYVTRKTVDQYILETLEDLHPTHIYSNPVSFRQLIGLGQATNWDHEKLLSVIFQVDRTTDPASMLNRMNLAREWLETYHPEEVITLNDSFNDKVWETFDEQERKYIAQLYTYFKENHYPTLKGIESFLYDLPKADHTDATELKKAQKQFFQKLYMLLINKPKGPRLGTFLWATPRKSLLNAFASAPQSNKNGGK